MNSITTKAALITGASSGIGAALAVGLSRAGVSVCLFARRRDRLEQAAAQCPGPTMVVTGDVTSSQDRAKALQAVEKEFGRLDFLINNAGFGVYGEFESFERSQWDNLFEVNFFAPVELIRQALPLLRRSGAGSGRYIVNVASIGGLVAHADKVTPYVAAKHALVGLSRGLAVELAPEGIAVKAVCPHLTDTDFFNTTPGSEEMAAEADKFRSFMDTPGQVAEGIIAKLDEPGVILFPTEKPARAYAKMRDI